MGSMLEFGPPHRPARLRLYVSGDTLPYEGLAEIATRFPAADLAVLHLGGTRLPGGFVVTMDGAQGAELARQLAPEKILPVHYGDYTVMRSPLSAFLAEAERAGLGPGAAVSGPTGSSRAAGWLDHVHWSVRPPPEGTEADGRLHVERVPDSGARRGR